MNYHQIKKSSIKGPVNKLANSPQLKENKTLNIHLCMYSLNDVRTYSP